jgi:transposase
MDGSPFLSLPEGLEVATLEEVEDGVLVWACSTAECTRCPLCCTWATRIHSHSPRTLADVPCGGRSVQLRVRVRKFFCDQPTCTRKIFSERLAPFAAPHVRMTARRGRALEAIGLATCGRLGARLASRLGLPTSRMTIVRLIMRLPALPAKPVTELGIDDFSFRRRMRFGTILVDLERHRVIDLLPDRQAATSAAWMRQQAEIRLVSRDRGEDYAAAARLGAPQATQVADRFHLVQNLRERLEVLLARCLPAIRKALQPSGAASESQAEPVQPLEEWHRAPDQEAHQAHLARQAEREDRFQQIQHLRQQGLPTSDIARRLGMKVRTAEHWLKDGVPYSKPRRKRSSRFDAYAPYVLERWRAGCQNGLELWRALQAQGYRGSYRTVYRFLATLPDYPSHQPIRGQPAHPVPESPVQHLTARNAVWLLLRDPTDLEATEQADLATIRQASSTVNTAYVLAQEFLSMVRHRAGARLDAWLEQVKASHLPELRPLVRSIERDKAAVLAGLTRPESQGQTEGQNTKLKLIKRTMYGRAGIPLLRQRVLHAF